MARSARVMTMAGGGVISPIADRSAGSLMALACRPGGDSGLVSPTISARRPVPRLAIVGRCGRRDHSFFESKVAGPLLGTQRC